VTGETRVRRSVRIRAEPDVPNAVLSTTDIARGMGFTETESRSLGTVVSELATNILKYAQRGSVTLEEVQEARRRGIQITVSDRGPGIEDVQRALEDHYSSSGTLGLGLPGVRRMVDDFDIESTVGVGTRVVVRKWLTPSGAPVRRRLGVDALTGSADLAERGTFRGSRSFPGSVAPEASLHVAHVNRPCRGEMVSGDAVSVTEVEGGVLIGVVDGLGHGRSAHLAAKAATRLLRSHGSPDLVHVMSQLHERLQNTVGAAVSVCWIDLASGTVRYSAIGNTVLRIHGATSHRLGATPGTVGAQVKTPRLETAQLNPGDVLIMHTDGVSDRTDFEDYPQLRYQGVETVADRLVSQYGKRHDDATVVVCKWGS
jgi:anti-sigma regulatory factor (Ser/Thr protein kinase)/serine/threonine protein phosphatase PrpC